MAAGGGQSVVTQGGREFFIVYDPDMGFDGVTSLPLTRPLGDTAEYFPFKSTLAAAVTRWSWDHSNQSNRLRYCAAELYFTVLYCTVL